MFWNLYDTVVVTGALLVTAVQIVLAINNRENYALLQIEKVQRRGRRRHCAARHRHAYRAAPPRSPCVAARAQALVLLIALRLVQKLDQLQMLFKTLM